MPSHLLGFFGERHDCGCSRATRLPSIILSKFFRLRHHWQQLKHVWGHSILCICDYLWRDLRDLLLLTSYQYYLLSTSRVRHLPVVAIADVCLLLRGRYLIGNAAPAYPASPPSYHIQ